MTQWRKSYLDLTVMKHKQVLKVHGTANSIHMEGNEFPLKRINAHCTKNLRNPLLSQLHY